MKGMEEEAEKNKVPLNSKSSYSCRPVLVVAGAMTTKATDAFQLDRMRKVQNQKGNIVSHKHSPQDCMSSWARWGIPL